MTKRLFVDFDGTAAEFRKGADISELYLKGYFETLKPQMEVVNAVCFLRMLEDVEVIGATCYLTDSKYALEEKKRWAKKHLPGIQTLLIPCGMSKAEAIYKLTGKPVSDTDYLLDDYTKNLEEFKAAGGNGLKLLNGINDTNGSWTGVRIRKEHCYSDLKSALGGE